MFCEPSNWASETRSWSNLLRCQAPEEWGGSLCGWRSPCIAGVWHSWTGGMGGSGLSRLLVPGCTTLALQENHCESLYPPIKPLALESIDSLHWALQWTREGLVRKALIGRARMPGDHSCGFTCRVQTGDVGFSMASAIDLPPALVSWFGRSLWKLHKHFFFNLFFVCPVVYGLIINHKSWLSQSSQKLPFTFADKKEHVVCYFRHTSHGYWSLLLMNLYT